MFEIFGAEMPLAVRFFIAFIIVLALIGATAYVVRRFGSDRLGGGAARGRQPRLAVIDAAAVDGRRRLVLIRRDNVEHLMMIGGPTDVVIEANIVRAAAPPREAPPARPPAATDTLPRPVPLGEGNMWPLQPHPEPAPRPEPVMRAEPAPRPQRPPPPPPPQHMDEPAAWQMEPEAPHPAPPQRPSRHVDPLAGLAAELARTPAPQDAGPPPSRTPREREAPRAPQPSITDPQYNSNADQNLAEMAHRLEAALRRPGKGGSDARAAEPALMHDEPPPEPAPPPRPAPAPENKPARAERTERPERTDRVPRAAEAKPASAAAPAKSVYDSLEQEMASLLGRPNKT